MNDLPDDLSKPTGDASFIANMVVGGALMLLTLGLLFVGVMTWVN